MKSQVTIEENRLRIKRVFEAPRPRVFKAFTKAEILRQWWGCKQTTHVDSTVDFRVGGSFSHVMHVTGVGELTYAGKYEEIIEPEFIAWQADFSGGTSRVTLEFIDRGKQTELILTQTGFPQPEFGKFVSEGYSDAFNKLGELLEAQTV